MKKSQFSPNQIASILKELDNGKTAEEITRDPPAILRMLKIKKWLLS